MLRGRRRPQAAQGKTPPLFYSADTPQKPAPTPLSINPTPNPNPIQTQPTNPTPIQTPTTNPHPPNPQAGNAQFLRDEVSPRSSSDRHVALHFGQKPHAVIIACSDSRVPPVGAVVSWQGTRRVLVVCGCFVADLYTCIPRIP